MPAHCQRRATISLHLKLVIVALATDVTLGNAEVAEFHQAAMPHRRNRQPRAHPCKKQIAANWVLTIQQKLAPDLTVPIAHRISPPHGSTAGVVTPSGCYTDGVLEKVPTEYRESEIW